MRQLVFLNYHRQGRIGRPFLKRGGIHRTIVKAKPGHNDGIGSSHDTATTVGTDAHIALEVMHLCELLLRAEAAGLVKQTGRIDIQRSGNMAGARVLRITTL